MKFKTIKIKNFKSFNKEQNFNFLNGSGLGSIYGINEVEPKLGANGTGKSTLWDALTWCLFGKSTRGIKGPNLLNWNVTKGGYSVEVVFEKNDTEYTLVRSWKPNKLEVNKKTYTQEEIDDLINFDYDSFLYLILMGQFNEWFFDLQPSKQLDIFTNTLNLDIWYDLSDNAGKELKHLKDKLELTKSKKFKLEGTIESTEKQLKALQEKKKTLLDDIEKECIDLENQYNTITKKKEDLINNHKEAEVDNIGLEETINNLQNTVISKQKEKKEYYDVINEINSEKAKFVAECNLSEKQFNKYGSLGDVCPECGQDIEKGFIANKIAEHEVAISRAVKEIEALDIELAEVYKEIDKHDEDIKKIEDGILEKKQELISLKQVEVNFNKDIANFDRELKTIDSRFDALEQAESDIDADINTIVKELKNVKDNYIDIDKDLDKLESEINVYEYWKAEFKQIRLWIVEKILKQLELEVNIGLEALGLINWQIKFDIERETKSGGISKGFSVMVLPPDAEEPVAWNSYSGGETQRLRIAGNIGLSNLIKSIKGIDINIEIWDEPTAHLSAEGIEDLLNFFKTRSTEKELWLIDHRSLDFEFDKSICIRKKKEGSIIEEAD